MARLNFKSPIYWADAVQHLSAIDTTMAALCTQFEPVAVKPKRDAFTTLARAITGQQISVKASQAIWDRLLVTGKAHKGKLDPKIFMSIKPTTLKQCGLSLKKVEYIRDLAEKFTSKQINPRRWSHMEDQAVIEELVSVRGIGVWTAEMFLIFNLWRPDIFPLQDIGLQKAVMQHYSIPKHELAHWGAQWSPYRTVAVWYLWRSLDPMPVEY